VQSLIELEQAREERLKRRVYNIDGFSPTAVKLHKHFGLVYS